MKNILFPILAVLCFQAEAQTATKVHSHNDYLQTVPFWTAYNAVAGSVEADIFSVDGQLYVARNKSEAKKKKTLDALYIEPLLLRFEQNRNRPWPDSEEKLQLLIDIKSSTDPALDLLTEKLARHRELFDRSVNPYAVQVVVTGNIPDPEDFGNYPAFIMFEGRHTATYSTGQLERIALYGATWNVPNSKTMPDSDRQKIKEVIDTVHGLNKKIRIRATIDSPAAWEVLTELGVDYVNTDKVNEFAEFLQ